MSSAITTITPTSIIVHRQGNLSIPFAAQDGSNISGKTYNFKTSSGLNVACVADPNNATGKLISLTLAQVQAFTVGTVVDFALVDQTAGANEVVWAGKLQVVGF